MTDMAPNDGDAAAAIAREWEKMLGDGSPTSFSDESRLFKQYRLAPVNNWETSQIVLKNWAVGCHAMLGVLRHPINSQMEGILESTDGLRITLKERCKRNQSWAVGTVRYVQVECNESFRQALHGAGPVICPEFGRLTRKLAVGSFDPHSIEIPGFPALEPAPPIATPPAAPPVSTPYSPYAPHYPPPRQPTPYGQGPDTNLQARP
mmetsp:Transcript_42930/g.130624  ORF Transcript_42930/g.130624 Transcript_42930/m.130624 type:complete len:206 (-) Transcript_42930:322-939(-)